MPSRALNCQIQWYAAMNTYRGPIDGVMGSNSWIGFQHELAKTGYYSGSYSGQLDSATAKAMQNWGRTAPIKYSGPVDGVMGPNSWKSLASILEVNWLQ